jgi:integrase/recombinase XerD
MSNTDRELIAELRVVLTRQRYSPVAAGNYCAYAREILGHQSRQVRPLRGAPGLSAVGIVV